jgi:UDP-glucose 4-epimerase
MAWLITGGAGYIGAHVVRDMVASGREVVVLDDLSTGRASRLPAGVPLIKADINNRRAVRRAFTSHPITGVMHFAARKQVGESVERPLYYWSQNVGGLQVLLEEMVASGTTQMVFSSSAAVYGQPDLTPGAAGISGDGRILESAPRSPMNPYGATKLAGEHMIAATAHAHQWHAMSLRYFNVAGAASPELGDPAALNLIPMVLEALETGRRPKVFGDDYPTPDGSCIRDYIHVADLSAAHVAAARIVEISHQAEVLRAAGDRVQDAAARAESAASRIPGGSAAVEAASHVPARAIERMPAAARAVEMAAQRIPGVIRSTTGPGGRRGQAGELVAEVASQLGSMVARVAGVEDAPRLEDHVAVNIGTGTGYSVFQVIEALRRSMGKEFAVDIVARRAGDPPALVADPGLAGTLLGWRARRSLSDMTDSAWAAWQARP